MGLSLSSIPRLTVVVPTADRGDSVTLTLNSIFSQTYQPDEIILVDNGRQAVEPLLIDKRVHVIRTAPRIGPGMARNIGALAATGDLVAFLDDDDLWDPKYLECVIQCFEISSADAVLGCLMRKLGGGEALPYKKFPCQPEEQRKVFYSNPGFGGQNLTIRRDVFLALEGFDKSMPASEDRDLAARLLLAGKRLVPEPAAVAILCDHVGSRARHSMLRGNWAFIKKHWRQMRLLELYKALKVLLKRHVYTLLGR